MADQGVAPEEQQLKQRAMRRLAVALTLIALAIAGLALLDRYHASQKQPQLPPGPPEQQAIPGEPATRPPPPATEPSPAAQPQATPQQAPPVALPKPLHPPAPPPPVVSNEPLPRAESNRPVPKAGSAVPEDTTPATKPAPPPAPEEKATSTKPAPATEPAPAAAVAKPAGQPLAKGFVVQVGVFATPEHARALQAKLAEKGIQSSLETRVVVGPFKDRAEADAATKQLKDLGLQGVVMAPH